MDASGRQFIKSIGRLCAYSLYLHYKHNTFNLCVAYTVAFDYKHRSKTGSPIAYRNRFIFGTLIGAFQSWKRTDFGIRPYLRNLAALPLDFFGIQLRFPLIPIVLP